MGYLFHASKYNPLLDYLQLETVVSVCPFSLSETGDSHKQAGHDDVHDLPFFTRAQVLLIIAVQDV
ncbi:unnamed protein product, partial [marine sediment metagenome]